MGLKYKGKIEKPLDIVNKQYVEEHFIEKYEVMPTASADYENKIVQYIGITDINYTNAYFYKCVEILPSTDPKTYKWNKVPVQEIKDIVVFTEVDALPTTDIKDYTIYRLNKGSVGSGWKYKKFDNLNKDLYTTDYDGITEIATGILTTWNDVNTDVTTKDNWEAKMEVTTFDNAQAVVTPDGYYPDFNHIIYHKNANTYEYWVYCGGVWKQFDSEGQIIQVDTMPTASSTLNGKIYQFVGTTTVDYTNGYFYKCVEDSSNPGTYIWQQKNVQPSGSAADIIDNLESTDTDKALSANMGRVLNNKKIEQVSTLPTPSTEYIGKILQYIGIDIIGTEYSYLHGCFYELKRKTVTDPYQWLPVNVDATIKIDNSTIGINSNSQLQVKDAGLTVSKFNSSAISTSIESIGSDTKLPTEKAVRTDLNKKLSLTGGTMTGPIKFATIESITRDIDDSNFRIYGGTAYDSGASIQLDGKDCTGWGKGVFFITATDGTDYKELKGKPDGTFTWNGKNIITEDNGDNRYLKLAGGTMTGPIQMTSASSGWTTLCRGTNTSSALVLMGGTGTSDGSWIRLNGTDNGSNGNLTLKAQNASGGYDVTLKPNGQATWMGKHILRGGMWKKGTYQSSKGTVVGNSQYDFPVTCTADSGYIFVGMIGFAIGNNNCRITSVAPSGWNDTSITYTVRVKNTSSSSVETQATVALLEMKTTA